MLTELWSDLRYRLRAFVHRDAVEQELDEELRFHVEHEIEKHMRLGVPRAEATRRARLAFGGVDRIKDDTRDARGVALADSVIRDTRHALRGLRTRSAFAVAVIATLALGIGINAAMFGVLDRLLLRIPAFLIAPERVHRVYLSWMQDGSRRSERNFEYTRYADLARWTSSFDAVAAFSYSAGTLSRRRICLRRVLRWPYWGTPSGKPAMPVAATSSARRSRLAN